MHTAHRVSVRLRLYTRATDQLVTVLALLLQAGCDVEMPNRFGQTSFHTAAQYGQYKALRALMPYLEHDVTDLRDETGATPLHCAALTDQWQVTTAVTYL
eukprot:5684505-Pyramimonas_sp.AAC.2